ncbi:MAG: hypothetical protein Q8P37_00655, partial [Candidatus Spechtbacteria bacterium]|nr:hypothetical protein [Candidatus Spechtbacteria bacterium]
MPKYRLAFIIFLLLIAVLLGIFDSTGTNTAPGPTKNPMATSVPNNDTKDNPSAVFVPPSSNRSIDTARAIADYITEKSNGLLAVPYTEIPDHG